MLPALPPALLERLRPWYLRHVYFRLAPEKKPDYFSACWNFPEFSPPLAQPHQELAVIVLPMNDWHTRMQRTQHLSRDLARRGFPVIYVNPHLGREFPRVFRRGEPSRLLQLENSLFELHVHLPREPVFHHRLLTRQESAAVAQAVTQALAALGARRAVQMAAFPLWLEAALAIRDRHSAPLVYDCHDYLPGFSNIAPEIVAHEAALFRSADLILCTSDALMRRAAATPAPRQLVRNAADNTFFRLPLNPQARPMFGYAGALDSWFDVEALRYAAEARPEWRFELIGRIENEAVSALARLPNVELAGEIPFTELPARLARFTAALIPFRLNPLIEATDPIKAYEYLAAGLPVVASRMPELQRFGDLIAFYTTPADFVARLDEAAAPPSPAILERRRAQVETMAKSETWQARGATLADLLTRL